MFHRTRRATRLAAVRELFTCGAMGLALGAPLACSNDPAKDCRVHDCSGDAPSEARDAGGATENTDAGRATTTSETVSGDGAAGNAAAGNHNPTGGSAGAAGASAGTSAVGNGGTGGAPNGATGGAGGAGAGQGGTGTGIGNAGRGGAAGAGTGTSCPSALRDCNGDSSDGCEVNVTTDADHCGACAVACDSAGVAVRACVAGACKPLCDYAHRDCNADGTDGCEVDVFGDPDNCGGCGHICDTANTSARGCYAATCTPTCKTGRADCHSPPHDELDDGCETDITRSDNCGACGHDCRGGACTAGECQPVTVAANLSAPSRLAVNSAFVFWLDQPPATPAVTAVERIPVGGGQAKRLFDSTSRVSDVTADADFAYFAVGTSAVTSDADVDGKILRAAPDGSVQPILQRIAPNFLTATDTDLVWSELTDLSIRRATKSGAEPKTVAPPRHLVFSLTTDGQSAYGTTSDYNLISVDTDSFVQSANVQAVSAFVATDSGHVYSWFVDGNAMSLGSMAKSLSSTPRMLFTDPSATEWGSGLAVSGDFVYFAQSDGIYRVPTDGGSAERVVTTAGMTPQIVAQDGVLYFIDPGTKGSANGAIRKLAVF